MFLNLRACFILLSILLSMPSMTDLYSLSTLFTDAIDVTKHISHSFYHPLTCLTMTSMKSEKKGGRGCLLKGEEDGYKGRTFFGSSFPSIIHYISWSCSHPSNPSTSTLHTNDKHLTMAYRTRNSSSMLGCAAFLVMVGHPPFSSFSTLRSEED